MPMQGKPWTVGIAVYNPMLTLMLTGVPTATGKPVDTRSMQPPSSCMDHQETCTFPSIDGVPGVVVHAFSRTCLPTPESRLNSMHAVALTVQRTYGISVC